VTEIRRGRAVLRRGRRRVSNGPQSWRRSYPGSSNYTDFEPLAREWNVDSNYEKTKMPDCLDLLCLRAQETHGDLDWLRRYGMGSAHREHCRAGGLIVGLRWYQMLGRVLADPGHVESAASAVSGLGC